MSSNAETYCFDESNHRSYCTDSVQVKSSYVQGQEQCGRKPTGREVVCQYRLHRTNSHRDQLPKPTSSETPGNAAAVFKDTATQQSTRTKNNDVPTLPELPKEYASLKECSTPLQSLLRPLQLVFLVPAQVSSAIASFMIYCSLPPHRDAEPPKLNMRSGRSLQSILRPLKPVLLGLWPRTKVVPEKDIATHGC